MVIQRITIMKKTVYLYLRFAAICCFVMLGFAACSDSNDELASQGDQGIATEVNFRLLLNLPIQPTATRVNTTSGDNDSNAAATSAEQLIDVSDIYILRFDNNNSLVDYITDMTAQGQDTDGDLILSKTLKIEDASYSLMILANLQDQGITNGSGDTSITEIKQLLTDNLGNSRAAIKQLLRYKLTEKWDITSRRIPMWGTHDEAISFNNKTVSCSANLYRAIAKIHILVNAASYDSEGLGLFKEDSSPLFEMTSIRVYYPTEEGFCAPIAATPDADPTIQFTQTDIPSGASQLDIDTPLVWEPTSGSIGLGNTFINQIYLPESNNIVPTSTAPERVKMVIGGIYHGPGLADAEGPTYYRIDLADYDSISGQIKEYDLIRNHSYVFNIVSVQGPGTPTPKQALNQDVASMTVDAYDIVENLRGVNTQYTLTTDKSYVSYTHEETNTQYVTVGLENYPDWNLVDNTFSSWCTIVREGNRVKITPQSTNSSIRRQTEFYIEAGKIKKQIIVVQDQPESANCYLATEGIHAINVTIKGNGIGGNIVEGVNICEDMTLNPAYIKVIWETKSGLIQLESKPNLDDWGATQAIYDSDLGALRYKINTGSNYNNSSYTHFEDPDGTIRITDEGGNALIGAFDDQDNIIWSWHIWVCPDVFDTDDPGNVKEGSLQDWTLNGYKIMDRNLGALSNQPGVSSLGLLYQWGRKDPFIGAASISESTNPIQTVNYLASGDGWGVNISEALTEQNAIDYTIQHPEKLIQDGLSEILDGTTGKYLWGTAKGFDPTTTNLGLKTVYDPCPPGYRVPPVDAYVFSNTVKNWKYYGIGDTYTEVKSSLNYNWTENLIYVPHCVYQATMGNQLIKYLYFGPYVNDAPYYGFFINYQEFKVPTPLGWDNTTHRFNSETERTRNLLTSWKWESSNADLFEEDEYCYLSENPEDFTIDYSFFGGLSANNEINWSDTNRDQAVIQVKDQEDYAWFPISGAYDPGTTDGSSDNKGYGFDGVSVTQGSSITVNSFLWTNSSDEVAGEIRPCAMFLHGAEHSNSRGSGRHIHALTGMHTEPGQSDSYNDHIHAEPQQASAVRCIRDVKKDFSALNTIITENVSLGRTNGSEIDGTVTSINQPWEVIDPGDSWVVMTPDKGEADSGAGTAVIFRALSTNTTGAVRTTIIKVHFNGETGDREISISQAP